MNSRENVFTCGRLLLVPGQRERLFGPVHLEVGAEFEPCARPPRTRQISPTPRGAVSILGVRLGWSRTRRPATSARWTHRRDLHFDSTSAPPSQDTESGVAHRLSPVCRQFHLNPALGLAQVEPAKAGELQE